MLLESYLHPWTAFCTLTYSDDHLPPNGSLVPEHAKAFLRRLQYRLNPLKFRYFIVGEYGEETWRPHYHAILFNVQCDPSHYERVNNKRMYAGSKDIWEAWSMGGTQTYPASKELIQYTAGYVTKKLTKEEDERLCRVDQYGEKVWLAPEFARMSRKPGIGFAAVSAIARSLNDGVGAALVAGLGDAPNELRVGSSRFSLGRYLRDKIAAELGLDHELLSSRRMEKYAMEMLPLLETQTLRDAQDAKNAQEALISTTRYKLRRKLGTL